MLRAEVSGEMIVSEWDDMRVTYTKSKYTEPMRAPITVPYSWQDDLWF